MARPGEEGSTVQCSRKCPQWLYASKEGTMCGFGNAGSCVSTCWPLVMLETLHVNVISVSEHLPLHSIGLVVLKLVPCLRGSYARG